MNRIVLLVAAAAAGLLLSACTTPSAEGDGPPVHDSPSIAVAEAGLANLMQGLMGTVEAEYGATARTELLDSGTDPVGGREACMWTAPTWKSNIEQVYPEQVPGYSSYHASVYYYWPVEESPTARQLLDLVGPAITQAGYALKESGSSEFPGGSVTTGSSYTNANGDWVSVEFDSGPANVSNSFKIDVALAGCYPDK